MPPLRPNPKNSDNDGNRFGGIEGNTRWNSTFHGHNFILLFYCGSDLNDFAHFAPKHELRPSPWEPSMVISDHGITGKWGGFNKRNGGTEEGMENY
jgi:hypothetical protein